MVTTSATYRLNAAYGFGTGLVIGTVNELVLPPGTPVQLRLAESVMFGGAVSILGTKILDDDQYSLAERTEIGVATSIGVACGHEIVRIMRQYL